MRIQRAPIDGAYTVELDRHVDDRGSFARTFCEDEFGAAGLPTRFPQCNLSTNRRAGTLRGMHYSAAAHGESKLVRCVRGAVHDVIVDVRPGSSTWLEWFGVDLTADNGRALFVPSGCAHGFVTLADDSDVFYHMGASYRPATARGLRWDDPAIGIDWPTAPTVLSSADEAWPPFDPSAAGS